MQNYTLTHLSDAVLLRDLTALVAQDRLTTATLLAHIAEVDARRLYVPAGYPSMHAYCVEELRLSEDAASKRIQAARAARRFPALFKALAEGNLHLTGVCIVAPHLTPENADELIQAATRRRKSEIEDLLVRRFSIPELPARVRSPISEIRQDVLTHDGCGASAAFGMLDQHAPAHVDNSRATQGPPFPEGFLVQVTIAKSTHDKLRYAQALLSHAVPTGDMAQVLDRALDALIPQLEKRKFGALSRGKRRRPYRPRSGAGSRYVPAHVRRAVWERDQGQCTFVSASGTRCKARKFLEFDHVDPVARGGEATVDKMRLRCRAHNQYEAERAFGAGFMRRKRLEARVAAAETRVRDVTEARATKDQSQDVIAGLRGLGCRASEARRAAEYSGALRGAALDERMRVALKFLGQSPIPCPEKVP